MSTNSNEAAMITERERLDLRLRVEEFNAEYCSVLDAQTEAEKWPDFFTEDATYVVLSQDNVEAGLPAGIMYAEGRKMMHDRIIATLKTQMFAPHRTLHLVSNTRIGRIFSDNEFSAKANVVLYRTLLEEKTKLHLAGYYDDVFVRAGGGLQLKQRKFVYQTMEIDRDLVYPA